MNAGYLIYQVERPRTAAEQREVDRRNGELAASLARGWHSLTAPLRSLRRTRHTGLRCSQLAEPGLPPA